MANNTTQYGLTAQTVLFYSDMVRCGFDWSLVSSQEYYANDEALRYAYPHI